MKPELYILAQPNDDLPPNRPFLSEAENLVLKTRQILKKNILPETSQTIWGMDQNEFRSHVDQFLPKNFFQGRKVNISPKNWEALKQLSDIELQMLVVYLRKQLQAFISSSIVQTTIDAYQKDDQPVIETSLIKLGYDIHKLKRHKLLYYDVPITEKVNQPDSRNKSRIEINMNEDAAIANITSLVRDGISSATNPETLPALDSVLCESKIPTDSLISLGFTPGPKYRVWSAGKKNQLQIVTPRVRRQMLLHIKKNFPGHNPDQQRNYDKYLEKLISGLRKNVILAIIQ